MEIPTFSDLKEEVIDAGLCTLCGGCTSFCRANKLNAIGMMNGLPNYINEENCLKCGICYMICPVTSELDEKLEEIYGKGIGKIIDVFSARSTDENVLKKCCDGGVATALLHYMLDTHFVDAVLAVKRMKGGRSMPILATSYNELLACAGSTLATIPSLDEIKYFSTYTSLLPELKEIGYGGIENIAITATPCQTKTIRKMQSAHILPSGVVKFIVGLFCIENFSFNTVTLRKFEEIIGGRINDIEKVNIKEKMNIIFKDGRRKDVLLDELKEVARKACIKCKIPFSNIYADVSLGGLGSEDGYTTVVIRTSKGKKIFDGALEEGFIEVHPEWNEEKKENVIEKIKEWTKKKEERK
ncbi:MAG: hypothetical protein FE041_00410 [Thermoplasmata archaeon]|nr:MAG: hypothetical protein FE041_00410 [Thermoplasmata archaeon]